MANIFDLIEPAVTTGIARAAVADEDRLINQFQLGQWFAPELVADIDFSYATGTDRTYSEAASFRAFDTPPRLGSRPGTTRVRGELPPIAIEYMLKEYERIKLRNAGQDATLAELLLPVVTKDIVRGVDAIERRFEFFRRDLLVNGVAQLAEDGIELDMDVGRNPARASTAVNGWDDPVNGVPLTDEEAILDTMLDDENIGPDQLIAVMNSVTWRAWRSTEQVRNAYPSIRPNTYRLTIADANELRSDNSLPDIQINDSRGENPLTGVVEKLIPDYMVLYLPRFVIGQTLYGVSAMADMQGIDIPLNRQPGVLAYLTQEIKPPITSTVVDGLGCPILKDPDATYAFTAKP